MVQMLASQILIAERLRPFCHLPGSTTILPGCGYQVQVFPCLIRLYHLRTSLPILTAELSLELKGMIEQFTIWNDLEKGRITVSGKTAEGWMRYHLVSSQYGEGIRLIVERAPLGRFSIFYQKYHHLLREKEWIDLFEEHPSLEPYQIPPCDRLSFGNHKSQDWELIKRRLSLAEIFPIWHRLGQLIPQMSSQGSCEGTLFLLETCRKKLTEKKTEELQQWWLNLVRGGFGSLMTPRLEDNDYQGLIPSIPLISRDISPLVLLSEGSRLIRRLFFQQEGEEIAILPCLLPCFPYGRLLNVPLRGGGFLSFEWTKKTIRRLILSVTQDQELTLKFRSNVQSYRLREHIREKGERRHCQSSLFLKKNLLYCFDNFQ
jgi:hypothetical protein